MKQTKRNDPTLAIAAIRCVPREELHRVTAGDGQMPPVPPGKGGIDRSGG